MQRGVAAHLANVRLPVSLWLVGPVKNARHFSFSFLQKLVFHKPGCQIAFRSRICWILLSSIGSPKTCARYSRMRTSADDRTMRRMTNYMTRHQERFFLADRVDKNMAGIQVMRTSIDPSLASSTSSILEQHSMHEARSNPQHETSGQ